MKKSESKKMEYSDIIEAILGDAQMCNLKGHNAQIVTGDVDLAKILVKGFCDAQADNVDVIFTEKSCAEDFLAVEEAPKTEKKSAVEAPKAPTVEAPKVEPVKDRG